MRVAGLLSMLDNSIELPGNNLALDENRQNCAMQLDPSEAGHRLEHGQPSELVPEADQHVVCPQQARIYCFDYCVASIGNNVFEQVEVGRHAENRQSLDRRVGHG